MIFLIKQGAKELQRVPQPLASIQYTQQKNTGHLEARQSHVLIPVSWRLFMMLFDHGPICSIDTHV